jgi:hypothetical protein
MMGKASKQGSSSEAGGPISRVPFPGAAQMLREREYCLQPGPRQELGKFANQEECSVCAGSAQSCAWNCGDQSGPVSLGTATGEIRREGQVPTLTEDCVPGTVWYLHPLSALILTRAQRGSGSCLLIMEEEVETQRAVVTCPKSHSK